VAAVAVLACWGWATQADAFVYWTNFRTGTIGRANLDGTGANQSFITGADTPAGVAVDRDYIYWTNQDESVGWPIGIARLAGTSVFPNSVLDAHAVGDGVAVDLNFIYWTSSSTIAVAPKGIFTPINFFFITGANRPGGVAFDGAHVYWTNQGANRIGRANLDGSGVDQSFITGAHFPVGVAVDALVGARCAGRAATIVGTARPDRLAGKRRSDVIVGGPGNDRIRSGGGADLICAGPGNDRVAGGGGNDRLFGGPGRDLLRGGRGNDRLSGGRGNDRIFGGAGRDLLRGGRGNDRLFGGRGNDGLLGGPGRDRLVGGPGRDDLRR
jgi:Ca2+-binding RTX toxin-like protein